ncbi:MAG TPA: hypothetical protein VHN18_11155 [Micromonosporaceae bacterium]|nr:hypothetical protein [Micromonosporaceae bacterium]
MQAAREQTSNVRQGTAHAGGAVAQSAVGQGKEVAAETGRQAHNLIGQASSELREQADVQQKRVAGGLRALGDEFQTMAGCDGQQGMASDLARQASNRAHQAADWLEQREPGVVVEEVRDYARHHPGMFLAGAAVAGMLAARLTRNLGTSSGDGHRPGSAPSPAGPKSGRAPKAQPEEVKP